MHRLVPALEQARATRGKKAKVKAIADALSRLARDADDDELATAVRLIAGAVLPAREGLLFGVGGALVVDAASAAYSLVPADLVSRARSLGDLGDAIGELAAASEEARPGLSVNEVAALARSLAATGNRTSKAALLEGAYARARPDQAKYLTKVLIGGLRIGVQEGMLEEAIAAAFGRDLAEVRAAAILCTDKGDLAVLARHGELDRAAFVVGSPVGFMLASPVETVKAPMDPSRTIWEDKLDGIRVQVHAKGGAVKLFARGGGEVSAVFPEIVRAFAGVGRPIVLDGELLAVARDDAGELRPRPFQALQARLNRKLPDADVLASTPVALFAFDMLCDGQGVLALPWIDRRARLDALFASGAISLVSPPEAGAPRAVARPTRTHPLDAARPIAEQIDEAYAAARSRGHEGIVLKDVDSPYEAGRRGSAWRKVKRAFATLDVVITRAERGHGKRAKVLSDYTFGVWDAGALVDIGKAYTGLTDLEIEALTRELEARTLERRGGQLLVEPTVVLEVAFDGIQASLRHPSGFALRFPRIVRIRTDKRPEDADTLATARALFDSQVASGHREEAAALRAEGSRNTRAARSRTRRKEDARQLRLFTDKGK